MSNIEDRVLEILNYMVLKLEPISYDDVNSFFRPKDQEGLLDYEKQNPEVGIARMPEDADILGSSVLAMIATITDVLVGKRLAVILDENRIVTGFTWYKEPTKNKETGA